MSSPSFVSQESQSKLSPSKETPESKPMALTYTANSSSTQQAQYDHHYNLDFGDRSTIGTWNYFKVLIPVKLMRAGTELGEPLGRLVGELEKLVKPDQVIRIKSSTSKRKIRINIHRNKAAKMNSGKPTAVHLNWHGSGWFLPGLGTDAAFIRQVLANPILADYPLTILDCDYAKSPEWPCPADVEDARDAIDYVLANPDKYDSNRITLSGFSAGGTIALGMSVALGKEAREKKERETPQEKESAFDHPIKAVFAVYPVATWQGERDTPKKSPLSKGIPGMILPVWFSRIITNAHLFHPQRNPKISPSEERQRKEELISQPIVSPACGENRDFSPIVAIYTAEWDHLTKKSEDLRDRLKNDADEKSRVEVYGETIKGVGHGWDQLVKKKQVGYKERDDAYDVAAQIIVKVGGVQVSI